MRALCKAYYDILPLIFLYILKIFTANLKISTKSVSNCLNL